MTTAASAPVLASIQTGPSDSGPGPFQPPRKRTVVRAAMTTMPTYSARSSSAKRSPAYSVR
jgi:hypothetical protein